ncbi:alpha/beta fold hydrolase [Nitrososphaera viennensis]|uniref:Alpha/beta hydrolase n=2 Tax=Nitrososphaera viennensis TaxID=1034015 RepID=A0A977IER1_9ARCH|nr:alpha/beta hydrolase [Nitrososphaera viennensis]UVS69416.1 alpha/beta hydrolase [Nitrososphaera viennensis]
MPQRMTKVNGLATRYLDYGSPAKGAKDLVLLHGLGASLERWLLVAPTLSKYFRVIVPDIVGFGYSDKPTVEYTMDFFTDFFDKFLQNLGIEKPHIVGSSFGGHLAAEYAIRNRRKIDKLALASPAGVMRTSTPILDQYIMAALYPTYENALKAFRDMAHDPSIVDEGTVTDFVRRMNLPNAKYAFMSTLLGMRYSPPLRGRLSSVIAPTLVIWGDEDRMIPVQYAKEFREVPNNELVVIKDCGHTPYIEKPKTFNRIVLKFLAGKEELVP